ncbi:AAA family ATPase [Natronomonas sp. F2-12]|uniref:AAA family ATPase n=1 Tax=Natronomonas aquatica TaxID=2841590 RepID=A0A9R1CVA2_9EURY|nr:AAA family ATPase [Natronomonas aquatica]MCQ4334770.1 AAA family ATPase [Natronomonas aquatica]
MEQMQIFEIILNNYRQYGGENIIPLETTEKENINIIEGQNGAGKSNILNAITLCFYGQEVHIDSRGDETLESDPYVTKRKLDELGPGESTEGYIEIKLGREDPKYAFRRSFTTVRNKGNDNDGEPNYSNSIGELKLRQRFGGNDWAPISNPENVLREILPSHVYEYFLFDGEQLDEFFSEGYSNRVKDAVLDISHVELLNNGVKHLDEVRREYERKSSKLGGDVSKLQSKKESAEDELTRLKERRDKLTEEISTAKEKLRGVNNDLSASGDDAVREMQERRTFLEEKLEQKDEDLIKAKRKVGTSLAQAGGVAYNSDALTQAITKIKEYESDGSGLPGLNEELLRAIVSRKECICGTKFSESAEAREHIEEQLKNIASNGKGAIDGRLSMEHALNEGENLVNKLTLDQREVENDREWIDDKEAELANISAKLEQRDTIDDEKAAELEKQRKRISKRVDEMNREMGQIEEKIESQEDIIKDRQKKWEEAMDKREKNANLVRKSRFVSDATDTLNSIKRDILDQVRSETENRLEQYYNDLIWKDEEYDIDLTDDYEVEVFNQDGRKNLGSLAAGERQVLALSFMAALSKISGFSAPIVIDTPLGRISSDPKRRIAQNIPSYLEETQVTFLMTDVEYSEDVRAFIAEKVANEYHLEYKSGVTEVGRQ